MNKLKMRNINYKSSGIQQVNMLSGNFVIQLFDITS